MKIGYCRVSTNAQELDSQIHALEEFGCERIYQEKVSTRKKTRAELDKALNALREGDLFVVWRLDRLGRDLKHLIEIIEKLKEEKIEFVSISEGIDTSSPTGELVFHVFASIAQFERSINSERTRAGIAAAKKRGVVLGRKPSLTAKDARKAFQMLKAKSVTKQEIAKYFGVSRPTLDKALKDVKVYEQQEDLF